MVDALQFKKYVDNKISGAVLNGVPGPKGPPGSKGSKGDRGDKGDKGDAGNAEWGLITGDLVDQEDLMLSLAAKVEPVGTPAKNKTIIHNGSDWVVATQGTSFTFSNASFTSSQSGTFLIGTGTWKAAGAISFSATYNNGPATSGAVSLLGAGNTWGSALTLGGTGFVGPTTNATQVDYPSSLGTVTFRLTASDGTDTSISNATAVFVNNRYYGLSTATSGWSSANVLAFGNTNLSNSGTATITLSIGSGQYFVWASRTALGARTFKDNATGFGIDMRSPATVAVTNGSGFTENYYVYCSTNPNLGTLTINVT